MRPISPQGGAGVTGIWSRWLERELGIEVPEIGWPKLDRFRFRLTIG
jgi:hypothetical protein